MKPSTYIDELGRKFRVMLPDGIEDPAHGVIVGPPFLDDVDLPEDLRVPLHNELFHRGIFTLKDARIRRAEIVAAMQSVLKLSVERIMEVYDGQPSGENR